MTPLDMAIKCASASAKCERYKCPFAGQCKGNYDTCVHKEIALILRSQKAEIDSLSATIEALRDIIAALHSYITDMEKINKRYHDLVIAFQHGYRPTRMVRKPRKPYKRKKDPVEMDGDERYAQSPPPANEPAPPLVVI